MIFQRPLLATHSTPGARRAEELVFGRLMPAQPGQEVTVLTVINEDWKFMGGDDWLNTDKTQRTFFRHLGDTLGQEIDEQWARILGEWPLARGAEFIRAVGPVEETIIRAVRKFECDLIIIGARQKKQAPGFKARLKNKTLHPILPVPLLIAP